jgi:xanthine dehydrogenase accessory factor
VVPAQQARAAVVLDPVCGMEVAAVDSTLHVDLAGEGDGPATRSWFCGSGCLRAFAADPSAYLPQPA